jgi:hypothetical protein
LFFTIRILLILLFLTTRDNPVGHTYPTLGQNIGQFNGCIFESILNSAKNQC